MKVKFEDYSKDAEKEIKEKLQRALKICGLSAERYAKVNITKQKAVDTGALRNSITHVVQDNECIVGTSMEYAPYIEYGTGIYYDGGRQTPWVFQDKDGDWHMTNGQRARPYLKPALTDHIEEYQQILQNELKD